MNTEETPYHVSREFKPKLLWTRKDELRALELAHQGLNATDIANEMEDYPSNIKAKFTLIGFYNLTTQEYAKYQAMRAQRYH